MRAVTIEDGVTVMLDRDDLFTRRLQKSVEMSTPCPVCGAKATRFITVPEYGFGGDPAYGSFRSARCEKDGGQELINHPSFKGMAVTVETLGKREWRTYRDGVLVHESHGQ